MPRLVALFLLVPEPLLTCSALFAPVHSNLRPALIPLLTAQNLRTGLRTPSYRRLFSSDREIILQGALREDFGLRAWMSEDLWGSLWQMREKGHEAIALQSLLRGFLLQKDS